MAAGTRAGCLLLSLLLGGCGGAVVGAPVDEVQAGPVGSGGAAPLTEAGASGANATTGTGGSSDASIVVARDAATPLDVVRVPIPKNRLGIDNRPFFLNGMNLAWNNWSADLSTYDDAVFTDVFTNLEQAGGNALRLWVHIDGSQTPEWDAQGMPTGMPYGSELNLQIMLDNAASHHVKVLLSLFSFDIIRGKHGAIVTDEATTRAYVDLVLTGLVTAVIGHPGLAGWEICNEPQLMTDGYATGGYPKPDVLRFHALLAAAIHRIDPSALVTTADMFWEISPTLAGSNHYSDAAMAAAAGGDTNARLDFYQKHVYGMKQTQESPWYHDASYYGLDKPIIIGEFEAKGVGGWSPSKMYLYALDHGYAGALSWAYLDNRADATGTFVDAKPGIAAVYAQDPSSVRPP